jgi:hypothetical protein
MAMISPRLVKEIRKAVSNLNPEEVRRAAERRLAIGLISAGPRGYAEMEDFLAPPSVSHEKRMEIVEMLHRAEDPGTPSNLDVIFYDHLLPRQDGAFPFFPAHPERTVRDVLDHKEDLGLALARHFPAFRKPVVDKIIRTISRENALFALATALPNIVPNFIEVPWAIGEFASDTAVLTVNQVRMAFLIAAASDSEIGYREQKAQIASVIGGAFGWRALARELVGKIPLGGGLLAKAAVAYAGTFVVGAGLERFHRFGYGLTREERRDIYDSALREGRGVAQVLVAGLKKVDAA